VENEGEVSMRYTILLLAVLAFAGCTDKEKLAEAEMKNAELQVQLDSLTSDMNLKEEYVKEFTQTINEVYDNLENIRKREGLITKYSKDIEKQENTKPRERMLANIASIDAMLQKSKKQIRTLRSKSYSAGKSSQALQETVDRLQKTLEEKEQYIAEIKLEIDDLNNRVAQVEEELLTKNAMLEEQNQILNKAWYIIGDEDALKEKGIIKEEGGLFGLRKAKKVAENFSTEEFQAADKINTNIIPIPASDVRLISPHNTDSYHLVKREDNSTHLEIIDADEFWKIQYCVIMTKG